MENVAGWRDLLSRGEPARATSAQRLVEALIFLCECEARGTPALAGIVGERGSGAAGLAARLDEVGRRLGVSIGVAGLEGLATERIGEIAGGYGEWAGKVGADVLGQVYEQFLAEGSGRRRKAAGIYYTPVEVTRRLVEQTLGARCAGSPVEALEGIRVIDPACGSGAFLLAACDYLVERRLAVEPGVDRAAVTRAVVGRNIFGVDLDEYAIEITRRSLVLKTLARPDRVGAGGAPALNLRCGDSLLGAAPGVGSFDVVIGNPPWGQKGIDASEATKAVVRERYASARGIFDWFRPFVELGVGLLAPDGAFGMVLPDIVLLKDYEATRALLLESLALTHIDWLGMVFPQATIDAVTIVGRRRAEAESRIRVAIHDEAKPLAHTLAQRDFRRNPRKTFNLFLTPDRRAVIGRLGRFRRLGEVFEIHEGVHSGNIREELFLPRRVDESCRELIFGRDEVSAYKVAWAGRHIRLAAMPARRTPARYANVGKRAWHERPKVIVRRTGDTVQAAVDDVGRYVSNNFFVVLPARATALTDDGLCALLNSAFMTWTFRTVEPREGRAFAELKIKHLVDFPLPDEGDLLGLNRLGAERRALAPGDPAAGALDEAIDAEVRRAFGLAEGRRATRR